MNGSERLDEALRAVAQADGGLGAGQAVEAAAMAAWRQRIARQRRRVVVRWGAIAAAAAVVIVAGAWQWGDRKAVTKVPKAEVAVASVPPAAPTIVPVEPKPAEAARAPVQRKRTAGMPSRQAKSLRHSPPKELVTEFIPLRPVPAWDDTVPAQVVRVRVPRSELGRFGLAFPGQFVDGTVRADVLVGQDGMARAVRFVR